MERQSKTIVEKNLLSPAVWSLKWNQLWAQMLVKPSRTPAREATYVVGAGYVWDYVRLC